jgi:hypothetical protein
MEFQYAMLIHDTNQAAYDNPGKLAGATAKRGAHHDAQLALLLPRHPT